MAPSTKDQLQALTAEDIMPTEAHASLANFLTENGPVEVTADQAWAFIMGHRIWQSSDERKQEKEALKGSKAEEAEAKRIEREAARAEKKAAAEVAAIDREAKKAAKAAKAADSDEDLTEDATDEESLDDGEAPEEAKPKRRRRTAPAAGEF
jgi:Skp family chaperone for outer membrane proteins